MTSGLAIDWLVAAAVGMMRPLGLMLIVPLFSSGNLGGTLMRNAIAMVLVLPLMPLILQDRADISSMGSVPLCLICLKELCIGFFIGLGAAVPFWAVDGAGFLFDMMGGTEMSSVFNPMLGEQSSQIGLLFSRLLAVLFFSSGSFHLMLETLYGSYQTLPVLKEFQPGPESLRLVMASVSELFRLTVQFVLPAVVVMFLVDFGFGLLNRTVKQLDVFFLAMPIKTTVGTLIVMVSLLYSYQPLIDMFGRLSAVMPLLGKASQ